MPKLLDSAYEAMVCCSPLPSLTIEREMAGVSEFWEVFSLEERHISVEEE